MSLTERALNFPAAVLALTLFLMAAGVWSLAGLPVQLFPEVERPQITVFTGWRAAAPHEMESEIVVPIETAMRGIPGLVEISSTAEAGSAWLLLEFTTDTDMQRTLMEVTARLNRLPPLPDDADRPSITVGGWNPNETLISYFVELMPGAERDLVATVETTRLLIQPTLEAIPGVARVSVGQNVAPEEIAIRVDPVRAAQYGLTLGRIADAIARTGDISAGRLDEGRRSYTVRYLGKYLPEELGALVLDWRDGAPIRLSDLAEVRRDLPEPPTFTVMNGNAAIHVGVTRAPGANVLATLRAVKTAVDALNEGPLQDAGLHATQAFDPSVYIDNAIGLVTGNLVGGILLVVGVLWLFLRQARLTLLAALTIPVCLVVLLTVFAATGRSINVISLAGLAFAAGMVVDNAVVVLEAIVARLHRGLSPDRAAVEATGRVLPALFASTATTIVVFLPIVFLRDVEGQIFADLALTIAVGVCVSLLVCATLLPVAATTFWRPTVSKGPTRQVPGWITAVTDVVMRLTGTPWRRRGVVIALVGGAVLGTWSLMPSLSYLPQVKRDSVDAWIQFPVGTNMHSVGADVGQTIVERLLPFQHGEREPAIRGYSIWARDLGLSITVRLEDATRLDEMMALMRGEILQGFPDAFASAFRGNLFNGLGASSNVAMHLQASDTDGLAAAAAGAQALLRQTFPGTDVWASPEPDMTEPQLLLRPIDDRLAEAGLGRSDLGRTVRALGGGLWLGEYFDGRRRLDLVLRGPDLDGTDELTAQPIVTPAGNILPLGALVEVERTVGPSSIRRVDGVRTMSLFLSPPEGMALEDLLRTLKTEIEPQVRALLPADGSIRYGGSADRLDATVATFAGNLLLAVAILFVLMALLFRSAKDSALVVVALPLAGVGGMAMLQLTNLVVPQPLDLVTMIGFVILLGIVVNNAILLVDETRHGERQGLHRTTAVRLALELRVRPICMTSLTTVAGLLPMLLVPGEGSVIYRGLAAVIVGGLAVSTVFTLLLLPALMRLGERREALAPAEVAAPRMAA